MDTSAEMWALVGKLIALVAIPHAAAQGLSKLVAISSRPSFAVVAKVMDATAYGTLALTSALVVRVYLAAPQHNLTPADIEAARNSVTLGVALELYVVVYICVLVGVGGPVKAFRNVIHSTNPKTVNRSLVFLGLALYGAWGVLLNRIAHTIDWFPTNGVASAASVSLTFAPPLLGVLAIWSVGKWYRRQAPTPETVDAATD
ncbi:hypothetical protein [Mycolicibacterium conceptionense]|uniref:hypothetical protein n=1 Tax=Mycolicibacterium conceptionense TaxID=451644 RepID=UPI000AA01A6F|nr:hypothetical protein [Mycolicibacterium conceptionense]